MDSDWIDVRPITVLIGSNNAGKSSFIAPLLLLKQTLSSRNQEIGLVTRGNLANVGRFEDVVTDHDVKRDIVFGLRWAASPPTGEKRPLPEVPPGEAEFAFSGADSAEIVLTRYEVRDRLRRPMLSRSRRSSGSYTIADIPTKPPSPDDRTRGDWAALEERPNHFLFTADDVFAARYDQLAAERELSPFAHLYAAIAFAAEREVLDILEATSYLGPLREPLRRVYEISGDPPSDVGTRGEWAPEILYRTPELGKSTRQWMRHFDFGRSFDFETVRDEAFSIILRAGGGMPGVNAADTGFGASQILPLIVQGLVAPSGSLIITEQPEIHLNPRLQTRVADFFSHIAKEGGSVLCETHSEHLVMRLRTLLAQGEIDHEDVALYFVDRAEGEARIRPVAVDDDGRVAPNEWPHGFFQEATTEALALATEQVKRRKGNARRRRR